MKSFKRYTLNFATALLLIIFVLPGTVRAQAVQRIAAIVNDELITEYDLESRIKLVIMSTGLSNTKEVRQRISGQILRTLVDERLQMQEAKRRNISVSKRDMRRAKEMIEKQNQLPKNALNRMLQENAVPLAAMEDRLRAGIAWSKLLARRLRPRITVGEDEIDETLQRIKSRQGQTEYRLAEILLAVDRPDEEENIRRTAQRIRKQVQDGANFAAIARQFSQSATAAVGGDLGWMHEAELSNELKTIVPNLKHGTVSPPVKTVTGYRLLLLLDRRKIGETTGKPVVIDLRQIFLPFPRAATRRDIENQTDLAKTITLSATGCRDFDMLAREVKSPRSPSLGRLSLRDLSPEIQLAVRDVPAGKTTDPIKLTDGVLVLMVCSREGGKGQIKLPERDAIADKLVQRRLSLMARRYLRDIRLSAVIDIRI
ncbi:MAG: Chaperone SurA [Alphaproteobacteria bacterium MarineAlpha11_Bin1]|nr:MAG: Chaperone SurA [Alphaproteobacteria bacterium MarineAlpha11_Bin1]|tara:strand:- start:1582 stop:2865 length:1284 start_codon:yes stop_codon:yes gene_type:complete